MALTLCHKTPVFIQLIFAVFHTNKIKYANGVVDMPIFYTIVCTVLLVAAIVIKARNTIIANSIPDFHNWPQAGKLEDEGKM